MEDRELKILISRCLAKDARAWAQFVERFAALIFWAIKERLKSANRHYNQQDLEDIFQNVFVLLWEKGKLAQIKNRENISRWLVIVAANCAQNYFRNKREVLLPEEARLDVSDSSNEGPAAILDEEKINSAVEQIFEHLLPQENIILKLSYLYNKTHREIGRILKMPQNSVSSTIKRIKDELREELKEQGWEIFL